MSFRVFVLTASDAGSRGEREDISGPVIRARMERDGYTVVGSALLPDDRDALADAMRQVCDTDAADVILTTGGTGFSPRDCMPEATAAVIDRAAPGIPEAMRAVSLRITPRAMLSRAAAGIRKQTLIVNLPGSPKAVSECLDVILPALAHGLSILRDQAHNCARP